MHVRSCLILSLAALAAAGCSGDRATAPTPTENDADRAAAEFERVAGELGATAGPSALLTYASAAAALRGGARVSQVDITVGGVTEKWNAFGHELQLELSGAPPVVGLTAPPPFRAFLAWRRAPSGLRVIHLLSAAESGPIGPLFPVMPGEGLAPTPRSFLMYAEGRDVVWQGVSGDQTSRLVSTGAACPVRSALGHESRPTCVEASFTFGFSNVQAQPFALRFGPGAPPLPGSGTRTLSMAPQTVAGVKLKLTLGAVAVP